MILICIYDNDLTDILFRLKIQISNFQTRTSGYRMKRFFILSFFIPALLFFAAQIRAQTVVVDKTVATVGDGVRSIDMNGNGGGASISQMVTNLVIGRSYTLLFDMAGNPDDSPVRKDLFAAIAGFSDQFSFYTTGRTRTDMGWTTMSLDFVANDTSHLLQFDSITDGAAYGPALDNVRIVDATPVPVPAAGLLLLTALGGIGLAKRRKS